jgi:hypothetical protein
MSQNGQREFIVSEEKKDRGNRLREGLLIEEPEEANIGLEGFTQEFTGCEQ